MAKTFRALWVETDGQSPVTRRIIERKIDELPAADVLVRVAYSSLNYKDALSANGNRGVTRNYPHTPGIDAAGVVEASSSDEFHPGQMVLIAAEEMGANWPGGYAGYIHVPAGWLVPLPEALTAWESMALGTAGFTAAICVDRLLWAGVQPSQGEVLVTGATGGVGSFALALLAKEGFQAVAATGKLDQAEYLSDLGAGRVIHRDEVIDTSGKPLLSGRWAGVIDTVGGNYLSSAIRATRPGGAVTACGNAASPDLPLTVYPFILRGVKLLGVDATQIQHADRVRLWSKLAGPWKIDGLERIAREVALEGLDAEILAMLQGKSTGRVVVRL
ncbi:MAG TPA: YhdH/YhfP family quinone oxidoreductase [Anaerolineaceae bacterium]